MKWESKLNPGWTPNVLVHTLVLGPTLSPKTGGEGGAPQGLVTCERLGHPPVWQPVVQDEACVIPQAGEDYRGTDCTGTLIAPAYQVAAIRIGEDYRGDESPAPSGNGMKLVLRFQFSRQNLG
jgi:hypothetical protein